MRLGVFGGSFDPPHFGHVLAACWALGTGRLDRLLVVPALAHAFGKDLAPFPHRRRMAELAFADLARVEVSDLEARLGGPSYTVNTLAALRREAPDAALSLLVGTDLVEQIPSWHQGSRVLELATPLVIGRGGHARGGEDLLIPEVSSTEVRRRLAAGRDATALVPAAVLAYAREHGLYGATERGEPQ